MSFHPVSYVRESLLDLWMRPAQQVPGLDGLRALAILLVMGCHFFGYFWSCYVKLELPRIAHFPFFEMGWTGVDLFFVLSGYLIGKQLWRERLTTGTVNFKEFILRRGFRIWPLFYFALIYYSLFGPVRPIIWDYLSLSNFFRGGFDDAWSLSTEEQFYIFVPLLLIATAFIKRPSQYFVAIIAACFAEWFLRFLAVEWLTRQGVSGRQLIETLHCPIFLHSDALLAGLAIALASVLAPARFRAPNSAGFSKMGMAIFIGATIVGVSLRQANKVIWAFAGLGMVYGGLTLWVLWDRSILSAPLKWRIWYPISRLSFGMYLNNFMVLPGITYYAFKTVNSSTGSIVAASLIGYVVGTLVSMFVATITFVIVERPFLILRDKLLGRRVHMHAGNEERVAVAT